MCVTNIGVSGAHRRRISGSTVWHEVGVFIVTSILACVLGSKAIETCKFEPLRYPALLAVLAKGNRIGAFHSFQGRISIKVSD